jgi:hypothetical protein
MPALKNQKHEKFAQAVANGSTGVQAYKDQVSEGCTTMSAMTQASRLLADVKISSRVAELQKLANDTLEKRLGWNKEKALTYLVEVLETPIGEVDKLHRLAQEYRDTEDGTTIKLPSKADAMKQLAVMCGWNEPEQVRHNIIVQIGGTNDHSPD